MYAKLLRAKSGDEKKEGREVTSTKDQEAINKKKNEVKAMVTSAVDEYVHYCRTKMDVVTDLRRFGNDVYADLIKKKQSIDESRIKEPFCDGHYANKYFDLLKWWELFGSKRWPCLGLAASIVLGKPSHNGFQERVFSRGTYFDDPLKQRLKEESYERAVLNSLNQDKIEELMESIPQIVLPELKYEVERQQIEAFFAKEKVQKDIIGIPIEDDDMETNTENKNEDGDDDVISVLEDEPAVNNDDDDLEEKQDGNNKMDYTLDDALDNDDLLSIMTMMEKEDDLLQYENEDVNE